MARSYQTFDPTLEWIDEEGTQILTINLPEFKKEEMRVQLNAPQNLKISGERNLGNNKWSRFEKNVQIPSNCDVNGLRARFDSGVLYIIMPKKITPAPSQVQTTPTPVAPPSKKPVAEPKPPVPPKTTPETQPSQKTKTKTPPESTLQKPPSKKPETKTPPETTLQKPPGEKPETKTQTETALQKPPSQKPVSEPESPQPRPSQKPVTQQETLVQPKPTQADQEKNGKVGEPKVAEETLEEEQGKVDGSAAAGEKERYEKTAKAKEGGNDDDGGPRMNKKDSSTGSGVGATVASDLTKGLYGPKQLILNVLVGLLVVLALVIYVKYSLGRSSTRAPTNSDN